MAFDFPNSPSVGQVANGFTWDGEKWLQSMNAPNAAGIISIQVFTANGTYVPNANMTSCTMETVGGGGAGGSTTSTSAGAFTSCSVGGGGGGYARKLATAAMIGASQIVTIGAGGAAAAAGAAGGNGGTTSIGALCSAGGGLGGGGSGQAAAIYSNGALGGTATIGDLLVEGGASGPVMAITSGNPNGISSNGGDAARGFGAGGRATLNGPGSPGRNYGGGGGGNLLGASTVAQGGGVGAPGVAVITEYGMTALAPSVISSGAVRFDLPQGLSVNQQAQGRQNIYAAPFDAMAYHGLQINSSGEVDQPLQGNVTAINNAVNFTDGWTVYCGGAVQALASPYNQAPQDGFQKHVRIYTTAAVAGTLAASDYGALLQRIEGYRTARLGWGTANAQPLTVGFWVRTPFAGTFTVCAHNAVGSRGYLINVTTSSNGWEWKTVTFPGCTDGTWEVTTSVGIQIMFCFGGGSGVQGAANTWLTTFKIATSASTNFFTASGNMASICGLMVLPGNEAPSAARSPFVMRPWDQELIQCRRYFYNGNIPFVAVASAGSTSVGRTKARHPVQMRAVPTLTLTAAIPVYNGAVATTLTSIGVNYSTIELMEFDGNAAATSAAAGCWVSYNPGGNINVDARL